MTRILVITDELLGANLAGPALRAHAIADVLSAEHEVSLRSTQGTLGQGGAGESGTDKNSTDKNSTDEAGTDQRRQQRNPIGPVDMGDGSALERPELEELDGWADVIVFCGFVLTRYPWLRNTDTVLVADLYDPFHLEVLSAQTSVAPEDLEVADLHRLDTTIDALSDQLGRADYVLCASERQRDLWLGHLGAVGRLNPVLQAHDPTFRSLIDVCPFGIGNTPRADGAGLRGRTDGPFAPIGDDDPVVLWGGGVYEWLDAGSAIEAVGRLRSDIPNIRLVFLGGAHPTHGESDAFRAARAAASALGGSPDTFIFNDAWVPYHERHNYLLEADVGITTHQDHLETRFAFRTRVLDYLWCGLPMVLTGGDELGEAVRSGGAGVVCQPGDIDGIADGLASLLRSSDRADEARTAGLAMSERYRWERTLAPLVEFCRAPKRAPDVLDDRVGPMINRRSRLPGTGVGPLAEYGRDAVRAGRILRQAGAGDLFRRARGRATKDL